MLINLTNGVWISADLVTGLEKMADQKGVRVLRGQHQDIEVYYTPPFTSADELLEHLARKINEALEN